MPTVDSHPGQIALDGQGGVWITERDGDKIARFDPQTQTWDEYDVPNRTGLRLMTGNAGALELLVDGDSVPAIGEVGEVRRNVELDADKLKSGTAVTE